MKTVLIICSDNYHRQPRVLRTIEALRDNYHISVAGYSDAKEHTVNFIDLSVNAGKHVPSSQWHFNKPALIRLPVSFYKKYIEQKQFYKPAFFEHSYWTQARKADLELLKKHSADMIICHGIDTLPLAVKLAAGKTPVVFNAHEYYPLEFEQDKNWLRTEGARSLYFVKKYLPQCAHMFCVSGLIQKKYQEEARISSTVISNATTYQELEPKTVNGKIRIVHHGIALRERNIEQMATLIDHLGEGYELNFMMTMPDKPYYEELREKFAKLKNINFLPAVPLNELCTFLNQFDIGYYILPPVNFNTTYALPNKLFEFIQARLCLAFAPSPEMKTVIEKYQVGVVAADYTPAAVAEEIKKLRPADIMRYKQNAHLHAMELSAEINRRQISSIVKQFI